MTREKLLEDALKKAREALATLPEDALGFGEQREPSNYPDMPNDVVTWPLRDELLSSIDRALSSPSASVGEEILQKIAIKYFRAAGYSLDWFMTHEYNIVQAMHLALQASPDRKAIMEECAKVCEQIRSVSSNFDAKNAAQVCADQIRALANKGAE